MVPLLCSRVPPLHIGRGFNLSKNSIGHKLFVAPLTSDPMQNYFTVCPSIHRPHYMSFLSPSSIVYNVGIVLNSSYTEFRTLRTQNLTCLSVSLVLSGQKTCTSCLFLQVWINLATHDVVRIVCQNPCFSKIWCRVSSISVAPANSFFTIFASASVSAWRSLHYYWRHFWFTQPVWSL